MHIDSLHDPVSKPQYVTTAAIFTRYINRKGKHFFTEAGEDVIWCSLGKMCYRYWRGKECVWRNECIS